MVVKYVQFSDSKVLIYQHERRRKRRKSDVVVSAINRNCHHHGHYVNDFKCYSYILIYFFIVATIMMLSLPTTIAMNQNQIKNNENAINDVDPIIQIKQPNDHVTRKIGKNLYRSVDNKPLPLKRERSASRENLNRLRPTKISPEIIPTICNCSDGKMLSIQMVNCMQICAQYPKLKKLSSKMLQTTMDRHNNEHKNGNENKNVHDSATQQKRLNYKSVAISKSPKWQRNDSIIRMELSGMSGNYTKIPFKVTTIENFSQKSVNSISQSGMNEKNVKINAATTTTSTTITNLNEHFYSVNHQMMLKNGLINQTKRNSKDGENEFHKINFPSTMPLNDDDPNVFNYKLIVKRETRPVEMQQKNVNETEMMKNVRLVESYHQQTTSVPKTKVSFYRKQTINEFFDSIESQSEGVTESNGPIFDANRTTVSIISRNQNESEPFDYANFMIENNNGTIKSVELHKDYDNDDVILSNQFISGQHVDILKANNNFVGSTVATAITTTRMAQIAAIDDSNGVGNSTSIDNDSNNLETNRTCVGDPLYCNLTEAEYHEMLYDYIFPTTDEWILIGFHGAVFTAGLVGNVLVCVAVYANATMRTVTNIFIVNLAVADLLVIILCLPPTVVWDVTETWFLGEAMCKGVLYFQTVSVTVSVLTLTFISIDRWYAICYPLRYVSTVGRAWCSIALIWIAALLSDIPELINSTIEKKELRFNIDLFTQCVSTWDKNTEKNVYIARFGMLYVLPLFLMSVAYFKIICVLWKSDTIPGHRESCKQTHTLNNTRTSTVGNSSTMGQLRARRKAAKMLVVVVIMFAICYFPVHFLNIIRYTINIEQSEVITILSLISHWLCYANSAVNPLIYNFMSGKFRREFVSVLHRCRCNHQEIQSHQSFYLNAQATRLNTISPNARSLYHFTNQRNPQKTFREKQTFQTSFVENVCNIYTGTIDEGNPKYKVNANGKSHQQL